MLVSRLANKLNERDREGWAGVSELVYCGNLLPSMELPPAGKHSRFYSGTWDIDP
jgi:hypothetical protein